MLLLLVLVSALLYPINSLKIVPPSSINKPQIPADISIQHPSINNEQPIAIEGQFIVAEGNSDHLFRPYDFIKEDAIQFGEGDTKDTKTDDKVRHPYETINPCIQIIEGHFIYSDNHLFDKEDFEKQEIEITYTDILSIPKMVNFFSDDQSM